MFLPCNDYSDPFWRRISKFLVVLFWCSGFVFGMSAAEAAGDNFSLLMRRAAFQPVSIVGLCLRISFSFLITVLAVILSKPWLFLPASFVRSFLLAFLMQGIVLTWSGTAWLVLLLCSGGGMLSACSLLWFWFRHIPGLRACVKQDLMICIFIHVLAGLTEYYIFRC